MAHCIKAAECLLSNKNQKIFLCLGTEMQSYTYAL